MLTVQLVLADLLQTQVLCSCATLLCKTQWIPSLNDELPAPLLIKSIANK